MKATATPSVKNWIEETFEKISAEMKMTKASVEYELKGDLDGTGTAEYLMFYKNFDEKDQHKSSSTYTGLLRFKGKLSGKEGSFVMEDNGIFENGAASSKLKIIDASGLGELKNIRGNGFYIADQNGMKFEIDYNILILNQNKIRTLFPK